MIGLLPIRIIAAIVVCGFLVVPVARAGSAKSEVDVRVSAKVSQLASKWTSKQLPTPKNLRFDLEDDPTDARTRVMGSFD